MSSALVKGILPKLTLVNSFIGSLSINFIPNKEKQTRLRLDKYRVEHYPN